MAGPRIVVTIAPRDSTQESSLEPAYSRLVGTPGISVRQVPRALKASVDVRRIEAVGPRIEAVAVEFALTVKLDDLDAEVPLGQLGDRQSGVWAALGDGGLRSELAIERADEPAPSMWQFVSVVDEGGQRIVRDARPPRVTPSLGPMDFDQKFDDMDWHESPVRAADEPPEYAYVHIALYLAWLARNGLASRRIAQLRAKDIGDPEVIRDLLRQNDGKLTSSDMTSDGEEFTLAHYKDYVGKYDELVGESYPLLPTATIVGALDQFLDARLADWTATRSR